ncbi:MAG: CRISPR-associated helicase Cas3' [Alicyclobacillus sp.]|nr:CRISPR-associated helicase Cas3' [Alicyclobacillus sp.]
MSLVSTEIATRERGCPTDFSTFFQRATGHPPYPYQQRLALADDWPLLLRVPTGLGKTAAVSLAWLWRRRFANPVVQRQTPRRFVYCLPQRTLVQQTAEAITRWLHQLGLAADIPVHVLMGGQLAQAWDTAPERCQVLVGTQDQLLSRSLNRGYGMSRYRWPMHFALLNNDALWVIDEPQLLGDALATTTQLQALRESLGTFGPVHTVWMSATLQPAWLATVDFRTQVANARVFELTAEDAAAARPLLTAAKPVAPAPLRLTADNADNGYARALADWVRQQHQPGTVTLVVLNRVARAQAVYQELYQRPPAGPDGQPSPVLLVHSRFRPGDRRHLNQALSECNGQDAVVVATQAVEAGVDLSAATLLCELAPWSAMVQRMGRCNRFGESRTARIAWVDIDLEQEPDLAAPYTPESLAEARTVLQDLRDARLDQLPPIQDALQFRHVLRRRDLLNLFDTTPDLTGFDLDVSPYVRDSDDLDVSVFWRDLPADGPGAEVSPPHADEICHVPVSLFRQYLKTRGQAQGRRAWRWDPLTERWQPVTLEDWVPGQLLLLDAKQGGYDPALGFYPLSWQPVPSLPAPVLPGPTATAAPALEAHDADNDNAPATGAPVRLGQHLLDVAQAAAELAAAFPEVPELAWLTEAALHHDRGKAHPLFVQRMHAHLPPDSPWREELLAKSPPVPQQAQSGPAPAAQVVAAPQAVPAAQAEQSTAADTMGEPREAADMAAPERTPSPQTRQPVRSPRGFRHELASALAYLADVPAGQRNDLRVRLLAYLIAAHHGKVRMHLRSVPTEPLPDTDRLFARGVWDGDTLPAIPLPDGRQLPAVTLHLDVMQAGTDAANPEAPVSWLLGVQQLLAWWGPFRLAWLETMLRVADWRASAQEAAEHGE